MTPQEEWLLNCCCCCGPRITKWKIDKLIQEGKTQTLKDELEFLRGLYSGGYVPSRWKKIEERKLKINELISSLDDLENKNEKLCKQKH